MFFLCLHQLIAKTQQAVSGALDQSGASDVGKFAKAKLYEYKRPTFMSSVSPAPVRNESVK